MASASSASEAKVLLQSDLPDLPLVARGKVRDVYRVDADTLLFVATDRLSAFDVVMKNGIPGRGKILTQISLFWFKLFADIVPNHIVTADLGKMPASVQRYKDQIDGRCMLVRKLSMLPVEAIVRGYIAGSGWKEYQATGTVCGLPLPPDSQQCERLPEPLYTPSTKAEQGVHDENIHPDRAASILGQDVADKVARTSLMLYTRARDYAAERGIIIADTKFEFGLDSAGQLTLGDEVLTPDSSRFWPASRYAAGRDQDSYDKQFVRNWLESIHFDKKTPIEVDPAVVAQTLEKYVDVYCILTGGRRDDLHL